MKKGLAILVFLLLIGFVSALNLPAPPSSPELGSGQQNNSGSPAGEAGVNSPIDPAGSFDGAEESLGDEKTGMDKLKIYLIVFIAILLLAVIVVFFIWLKQRGTTSPSQQNLNSSEMNKLDENGAK